MNSKAPTKTMDSKDAESKDVDAIRRGEAWADYLNSVCADDPAAGPLSGVDLLAMGDSWFHYFPPFDVLVALENKYGYAYRSVAVAGEKLAALAPPDDWEPPSGSAVPPARPAENGRQLCELLALLKSLGPAGGSCVSAVLLSGGGDDVASDRAVLESLLNPAPTVPAINADKFRELVDNKLRARLAAVLSATTHLCRLYLHRDVPIVIHGYAHPVPDGRGGGGPPWLKPSFDRLGYTELVDSTRVMADLIDGLNSMQTSLIRDNPSAFAHVTHVDVRPALSDALAANAYRVDWQNELHPTIPRGFTLVADRFDQALRLLPPATNPPQPGSPAASATASAGPRTRRMPHHADDALRQHYRVPLRSPRDTSR